MTDTDVRMWRAGDEDRVLLMAGQTTSYAVEPRGEYVFGIVAGAPMQSHRGSKRQLIQPGHLVAWDPSAPHAGTAIDARPWSSRLMVIEAADLATFASDREAALPADIEFPDPAVSDPQLVGEFVRMYRAFEVPSSRLERDQRLAEWLILLIDRAAAARPLRSSLRPRDDTALRLACEYLADEPERNISLDELASVAGIGKFRLIRLFRERVGLPPHALQIAHRVRRARRLLEAGEPVATIAATTGFADQSHLHRHFQRSLGLTPGEYRRRFTRTARD